ncbi:hypothetical protein KUTeg_021039 [Tegillarca granosa]|uniref:Uncharacterized protein n=1 Tax=Tegillarca granosa TaxID=220873 RepID=A0ABQ9EES5_TEGGR|nr:hypothetical protein KUTeg_021039 [Tegillarca granosa]
MLSFLTELAEIPKFSPCNVFTIIEWGNCMNEFTLLLMCFELPWMNYLSQNTSDFWLHIAVYFWVEMTIWLRPKAHKRVIFTIYLHIWNYKVKAMNL